MIKLWEKKMNNHLKLVVDNENSQTDNSVQTCYQKLWLLRQLETQVMGSAIENEFLSKIQSKINHYESIITSQQLDVVQTLKHQLREFNSNFLNENNKFLSILEYIVKKGCYFETRKSDWCKVEENSKIFLGTLFEISIHYKQQSTNVYFLTGVSNVSYMNQSLYVQKSKQNLMDLYLDAKDENSKNFILTPLFRQKSDSSDFDKKTKSAIDRVVFDLKKVADPQAKVLNAEYLFEERRTKADKERALISSPKGKKMLRFIHSEWGKKAEQFQLASAEDNIIVFKKKDIPKVVENEDNDPKGIA